MATTELQSTLVAAQTDIPYGSIETYDGTTITDASVLVLSLDGVTQTLTTDYTVDTDNQNLVLVTPATGGEVAVVKRVSDGDSPYVDYTNNTVVDANDLDLAIKQLLFLIQETVTTIGDFLEYSSLNAYWDGQSRTTSQFMPAATSTGLTTLGQVGDLIAGVNTASIDNVTEWTFEPTTSTTVFNLTDAPQGLAGGDELFVWVNGVHQRNTVGYTLSTAGAIPALTTTSSLSTGDVLHVVAVSGSVSTTFAEGSIDSDAIADDAIGLQHIQMDSGDASRVWLFTAGGNPVERRLELDDIKDFVTDIGNASSDNSIEFSDLVPPTAALDLNGQKVTNAATGSSGTTDLCTVAQAEALATAATANVYTDFFDVVNGSPETADVGFVPKTVLFNDSSLGGTPKFFKIESGDTLSISSNLDITLSGTTLTFTRTTGGTTSDFSFTAFG